MDIVTLALAKAYTDCKIKGGATVEEITDEQFLLWLNEAGVVAPIISANGELYITNNNQIYVL